MNDQPVPTQHPERTPATIRRRTVLKILAGAGIVFVAPAGAFLGWLSADSARSNTDSLAFKNPLKIPPLLEPSRDGSGRKQFRLELQEGTTEFLSGTRTATWGTNGPYLGPTLRSAPHGVTGSRWTWRTGSRRRRRSTGTGCTSRRHGWRAAPAH